MILGFRHGGLKQLFENDDHRKITPHYKDKISRILARLDEATQPQDMNLPGYRLHPLKGDLADFWAVQVSTNWRIVFRFEGQNVRDVDMVDYH